MLTAVRDEYFRAFYPRAALECAGGRRCAFAVEGTLNSKYLNDVRSKGIGELGTAVGR